MNRKVDGGDSRPPVFAHITPHGCADEGAQQCIGAPSISSFGRRRTTGTSATVLTLTPEDDLVFDILGPRSSVLCAFQYATAVSPYGGMASTVGVGFSDVSSLLAGGGATANGGLGLYLGPPGYSVTCGTVLPLGSGLMDFLFLFGLINVAIGLLSLAYWRFQPGHLRSAGREFRRKVLPPGMRSATTDEYYEEKVQPRAALFGLVVGTVLMLVALLR